MLATHKSRTVPIAVALLFSVAALALVAPEREQAASDAQLEALKPQIRHARTAEEILIKLQRRHYEKRPFDDTLSSQLLDTYLENLDPNKNYFTRAEIDAFNAFRLELDDPLRTDRIRCHHLAHHGAGRSAPLHPGGCGPDAVDDLPAARRVR